MLLFSACNNGEKLTNSEVPEDYVYVGRHGCIAEKDDSIYFVDLRSNYAYLEFINKKTGDIYPLCSRPECAHLEAAVNDYLSEESCNSNIGLTDGSEGIFTIYENYIYALGADMNARSIIRVSLDGSKKEKIADFASLFIDGTEGMSPVVNGLQVYKDNLFFQININTYEINSDGSVTAGSTTDVYKINLKGEQKLTKIFSRVSDPETETSSPTSLFFGKNDVYLTVSKFFENEDNNQYLDDIYKLNDTYDGFDLIKSDIENYADLDRDKNGYYYYSSDNKLMFASLDSDETEVIYTFDETFEIGFCQCAFYGDYLFLTTIETFEIYIYNLKEQKFIRKIEFKDEEQGNIASNLILRIENENIYISFFGAEIIDGQEAVYAYASIEDVINSKETWRGI